MDGRADDSAAQVASLSSDEQRRYEVYWRSKDGGLRTRTRTRVRATDSWAASGVCVRNGRGS